MEGDEGPMPTVTNLQRSRRPTRFFIERDRLIGGPFRDVLDTDRILVGDASDVRDVGAGGQRGRLTLRQGMIEDPFLRAWILRRRAYGRDSEADPEVDHLDLIAVRGDGEVLARWSLSELRILEICDRRRRRDDDPNFDYIILEALARHDQRT